MGRRFQLFCAIGAIALGGLAANLDAQRRAPGQAQPTQAIQASLNAGGSTYQSNAPGKCTHAPVASIFNLVAEMWTVQQNAGERSLTLTLWKPKDGSADMATLAISGGNMSHQINTVRGGGATAGSGRVTLKPAGNGGTFSVDAKTATGAAITGTITCDAFAPHTAEGG